MLERTVGCREPGSLRRLLPGTSRALKSRRALHSGFWHHNALDLELSPLYSALLHGSSTKHEDCELRNHPLSLIQAGFHLDFLYPATTVSFLRQYMGWGLDKQDCRRTTLRSVRAGRRLYTSSVEVGSTEENAPKPASNGYLKYCSTTVCPTTVLLEPSQIDKAPAELLSQADSPQVINGRASDSDYEKAWHLYLRGDESSRNKVRPQLVRYLSNSVRVVDAERIVELFEQLETAQKGPSAHSSAIRSYLRLRNLTDAIMLHNASLTNLEYPVGAPDILAYMIENSLWTHVINFWTNLEPFRSRFSEISEAIFSVIESRSNLIDPAIEFAGHLNARLQTLSNPTYMVRFASRMFKRAVINSASAGDQHRFDILLAIFHKWDIDLAGVSRYILNELLKLNEPLFAVLWYRKTREEHKVWFGRRALNEMLHVFCQYHSVKGMQEVMDDYFRFCQEPTVYAYRRSMVEFASQADSETVHALFDQLLTRLNSDNGESLRTQDLSPILHVHARRGELPEVIKYFDEIQTVHSLQPDVLCWNILLDAYGKAGDTDSALAAFEGLLASTDVQPDDYTFGTIMGICATRGDLERVLEIYQLSLSMNIEMSSVIVSSLVLAHIQNDRFAEAERICEKSLEIKLKGSKTRIWNHLLTAYAMRRNINKVNQLLRRMSEARLEYDLHTYSALMQALVMVGQPVKAQVILDNVMRDAGIRPTSFSYAIVMGGYLATRNYKNVYRLQKRMAKNGVATSASTKLLSIKAEDYELFEFGTEEQRGRRALEMFQEVLSTMDQRDIAVESQKGTNRAPRQISYLTMVYSYVIMALGETSQYETAEALYQDFIKTLPENIRGAPPIESISAIMKAKSNAGDWKSVQEFWELAVSKAKEQGAPIPSLIAPSKADVSIRDNLDLGFVKYEAQKILPIHRLDLTRCLEVYMIMSEKAGQVASVPAVITGLLEDGFHLDNKNWNLYIQILARNGNSKLAFQICEQRLMDNWTGWGSLRSRLRVRKKLPVELRRLRKEPFHIRPISETLLYLGRAYIDLQDMAAESRESEAMLDEILETCPRVINALTKMERSDSSLERAILRDE